MTELRSIAAQFTASPIVDVVTHGNGNINDTFLVTLDSDPPHFILQRINGNVFRNPALVQANIRAFAEHALARLCRTPPVPARRWEVPRLMAARNGRDAWRDPEGSFWRAMSFIEGARSYETVQDIRHAGEVGYALGMFHTLINDMPAGALADTLPGFHITPRYLQRYDDVHASRPISPQAEVSYCRDAVAKRRGTADVLEEARTRGRLLLRPIHGDPKVNNVLMDEAGHEAVSVIDLDTVKPGLIHYDVGDCLRSCCNVLGEETDRWEAVRFEPDLCRPILRGYLSLAGSFLTEADRHFLYDAARLIPFELGLRFFTDYLEGNVYFKVKHPDHNLARALVQFRLTESVESQESAIRAMIAELR